MRLIKRLSVLSVVLMIISPSMAEEPGSGTDQTRIRRFDMGHLQNPSWPGFTRVDTARYTAERGFGWIESNERHARLSNRLAARKHKPVRVRSTPVYDDLTGDAVFWRGGAQPLSFRVDLPPGEYDVVMWAGGWLGRVIQNRSRFSVAANGEVKLEVEYTPADLRRRIFREYDPAYEWRPGHDVWSKYVRDQYCQRYRFNARVETNGLDLVFHRAFNGGVPADSEVRTDVLPINGIVIYPAGQADALDASLENIEARRKRQCNKLCAMQPALVTNELPATAAVDYQATGVVPFVRHFGRNLYYNDPPVASEIDRPIVLAAARGERAIARFAVYPLRDFPSVELAIGPLTLDDDTRLVPSAFAWHWLRYLEQPLDRRRYSFEWRPVAEVLMPAGPSPVIKGVNRQFVVAVTPPPDAAPGTYRGSVEVRCAGGPAFQWPIEVTVYPFELETYPDDDERIWILSSDRFYRSYGDQLLSDEEYWEWTDRDLAFMKQYRIAPTILFDWFADMDELQRFMSLYMKYGFHGHPFYGGYELLGMIDGHYRGRGNKIDFEPFIERMQQVIAMQQAHGWPEFAFYFTAEIHTGAEAYQVARDGLALCKERVPEAHLVVLPNRQAEFDTLVDSDADIIGPNAISMTAPNQARIHALGKQMWFYGWGRERFRCGLIDWRLGNRGGLNEWYTSTHQASFNPFDGKRHDAWNDGPPLIGPEGPVPTMNLERTTAGRIDFLYLATLEQWIQRALATENAAAIARAGEAQAWLDKLQARIRPDYYYYWKRKRVAVQKGCLMEIPRKAIFGWAAEDYDVLRHEAATHIQTLKTLVD